MGQRKSGTQSATQKDVQPAKRHDTFSGKNRDLYTAALLLYLVRNTRVQVAKLIFMEKCYSYMKAGYMRSAIESAKRFVSLYTKNDWLNVFHLAHCKR